MRQQYRPKTGADDVTQIFNLLYRRLAVCRRRKDSVGIGLVRLADCNSAIHQIENLRYTGPFCRYRDAFL
jgi:hypothetical protein